MPNKTKPKDPTKVPPSVKHGDRYDKMNPGAKPKSKRLPNQKKFKPGLQQNLKSDKVQHG